MGFIESFSVMLLLKVIPEDEEDICLKRSLLLLLQEEFMKHSKSSTSKAISLKYNFTYKRLKLKKGRAKITLPFIKEQITNKIFNNSDFELNVLLRQNSFGLFDFVGLEILHFYLVST
jgi:hypothetical protein